MRLRCKLGIHKPVVLKRTGKYSYMECQLCGKRWIREDRVGGYQPKIPGWDKKGK